MTIPKEKNEILTPWLDINGNELRIGLRWNDARDEITLIAYDDNDHTCSYEASAWELLAITEHGVTFAGDGPVRPGYYAWHRPLRKKNVPGWPNPVAHPRQDATRLHVPGPSPAGFVSQVVPPCEPPQVYAVHRTGSSSNRLGFGQGDGGIPSNLFFGCPLD